MQLPFRVLLYRYLFFTWLFQDIGRARNLFESAAAWRHNQAQARWLPLYMLRYLVSGISLIGLGALVETLSPLLSAFFYVPGALTVPMLALAGVAWTGLHLPD